MNCENLAVGGAVFAASNRIAGSTIDDGQSLWVKPPTNSDLPARGQQYRQIREGWGALRVLA